MAVALCATACITTTAFAEDDFGIESASPVNVADPVNPQPGMSFSAYNYPNNMNLDEMQDCHMKILRIAAAKTGVDKGEKFGIEISQDVKATVVRWEGFLKCKRAATYTFLFQRTYCGYNGFSVRINGKPVIPSAEIQASCDVDLKVGWNKIEIIIQFGSDDPLRMSFKPKGSLSDPRPVAPKDLFYDQKPEEDW